METHSKYLLSFIIVLITIIIIISLTFFSTFILISDRECGVTINGISIINIDKKIFLFNIISPISSLLIAIILPFFILKYQTERENNDKKQLANFIFNQEKQSINNMIKEFHPLYERHILKHTPTTISVESKFQEAKFSISRWNILISKGLFIYLSKKDTLFNIYQKIEDFNVSTPLKKLNKINDIKIEFDKL